MASLLSEARKRVSQRTPIAGRIRPGTKLPTKASQENPAVMALYGEVLAGKRSFKEVEAILAGKGIRHPFFPKNPRDFRLSAPDIEGGQIVVERFMQLYGEDEVVDGRKVRKLYRFPVVFPDVPGGIEGFFKSEFAVPVGQLRYHSVYSEAGVRNCVYLKPVNASDQQQARRKKWQRREPTIRGECEPSICAEFASGACKFRGDLHFYVPGITGAAPFSMPTGSQYAAEDIFLRLEEIYVQCRGQIPRFDNQGNPVFFISKALKTRTYFDENGVEKRGEQWVPVLETNIDMSKLYQAAEQRRMLLAAPQSAPSAVSLPGAWLPSPVDEQGEFSGALPIVIPSDSRDVVTHEERRSDQPQRGFHAAEEPAVAHAAAAVDAVEEALNWIEQVGEKHGIADDLEAFLERKYGEQWFEGELPLTVRAELQEMQAKVGDGFKSYLRLLLSMYTNGIAPDLALRYLRMKVGSLKHPGVVDRARKLFDELVSQGATVAAAHMKQEIDKKRNEQA